jgi:uncharacterized glyoxalase superfamily protein PhnB
MRDSKFGSRGNRSMPSETVIPVVNYPDLFAASAWLCKAFGFAERIRIGAHRMQLEVGEGAIVLVQMTKPSAPLDCLSVSIMVRIQDADSHYEIAKNAGAQIVTVPTTQPCGERQYTARDLVGYIWTFSQSVADVEPRSWGAEDIA